MTANEKTSETAVPAAEKSRQPDGKNRREDGRGGGAGSGEIGGPKGPEPTRYGDWEVGGRCTDF